MPILPPKKRLTYRMEGEGSSRKGTKLPCRRSQRIAALNRTKNQTSKEQEVFALNSDSEHERDGNLEANSKGALPAAEGGAEEILPKNEVYNALWAMLDAQSENEEIPGQWDLDSVLNNWGKVEPNMGPAGNNQGPPPARSKGRDRGEIFEWIRNGKNIKEIPKVYATTLIGEMKGKLRKVEIGWEPRAFLTRYTRVNEHKHDRVRFLFLDSMTCALLYCIYSHHSLGTVFLYF
ncbi:hypothetical protein PIB30_091248 [Stylosanthes scabra]|uniref:Uncharacterized protein n=1 Tax=Stylosanthes scabra TaxID=79078 RepID=A0ABU6SUW0_9FABA|nr:hypothetical protein [Stylosanthes scabra]